MSNLGFKIRRQGGDFCYFWSWSGDQEHGLLLGNGAFP